MALDAWEPTWPGRPPARDSLGQRISVLRAERGWTQQQLADRLGISRVAVSHLETDLNTPSERTVAILAGLFRMEPHELVAATSYPTAKSDRLPLVVARWTEVEHRLALLERDLWWLDAMAGGDADGAGGGDRRPAAAARADEVLGGWEADLAKLADRVLDPTDAARVAEARRLVADRRHR
ncbi:MAG TPA: helix-turn-helix transcriptional regulator [Aquihabitans sp.]|nr:helix-turn-helix transcriptional regulator [Aquihabitans sp.]